MKSYLIGIDGGGTKTKLLAYSLSGKKIGSAVGQSSNISSNTEEVVLENLKALLKDFFTITGALSQNCLAVYLGSAGVDSRESLKKMQEVGKNLGLSCPVFISNDANIALAAQTKGAAGMLLISGTGSIAFGVDKKGRESRVGGYDFLVGDEGSAYWFASKAIGAALHGFDGIGEATLLLPLFLEEIKAERAEQLVDFVYRVNKSDVAALAPLVNKAREMGDSVAAHLMKEGANWLVKMIIALSKKLDTSPDRVPVVFSGGMLLNHSWLIREVTKGLQSHWPGAQTRTLQEEPALGAIYLAAKELGLVFERQ